MHLSRSCLLGRCCNPSQFLASWSIPTVLSPPHQPITGISLFVTCRPDAYGKPQPLVYTWTNPSKEPLRDFGSVPHTYLLRRSPTTLSSDTPYGDRAGVLTSRYISVFFPSRYITTMHAAAFPPDLSLPIFSVEPPAHYERHNEETLD